ncbi:MAG: hypothetical protein OXR73_28375 [Myxococcales bacterium]|nr:hypothetical protein [Myxococcales bacterium]
MFGILFADKVRKGHPVLPSGWGLSADAAGISGSGQTATGLYSTGLLEHYPQPVAVACALAASCVLLGFCVRAGALLLWLAVEAYCRYCYPVTSPEDALLGVLLLCVAVMPVGSGASEGALKKCKDRARAEQGSCATVGLAVAFLALFLIHQRELDAVWFGVSLVGVLLMLGAFAGGMVGELRAPSAHDLSFVGALVLTVVQGSVVVAEIAGVSATGVQGLAWDLGLLWRATDGGPVVAVERRETGSGAVTTALWSDLPQRHAAWGYLEGRSRGGAGGLDGLRARARLKQSLADRACRWRSGEPGGVLDIRVEATGSPVLSFRCGDRSALLVPPRLVEKAVPARRDMADLVSEVARALTSKNLGPQREAPLQAYAQRAEAAPDAHLAELLQVARYRFLAREFGEAARLLDMVVARASPAQRKQAGLDQLRRRVSRGGEAW